MNQKFDLDEQKERAEAQKARRASIAKVKEMQINEKKERERAEELLQKQIIRWTSFPLSFIMSFGKI